MAAVSSVAAIVCGFLLAVEAPSLLFESAYVTNSVQGYSLTYVTHSPILLVFIMVLGGLTFLIDLAFESSFMGSVFLG